MATDDAIIQVRGLSAGYGDRLIIEGLSVDITRGRVTTIIGGSGCGKSTLLKCVIGLLRPVAGSIHVDGQELTELGDHELSLAMARVGLLFQAGAMLNSITVAANVALPLQLHTELPKDVIDEMVQLKLDLVGLGHAGKLLPSELSGGMRKRAALARAMALDPALLLCDEPSAGLDPLTSAALDDLLLQLKDTFGMSLVVVTHELASIEAIADDVVMLSPGGILRFAGSHDEARQSEEPHVRDFFGRRLPTADAGTASLYAALGGEETGAW